MPTEVDFLEAIRQTDDDGSRLVFADWLEERGDPRGEFMRLQVELANWVPDLDCRTRLKERESELFSPCSERWGLSRLGAWAIKWGFRRGLAHPYLHAGRLADQPGSTADILRQAGVHTLSLTSIRSCREKLAGAMSLGGVRVLWAGNCLGDEDLVPLLTSPAVSGLRGLNLSNNRLTRTTLHAILVSPFLRELEWLDLRNNDIVVEPGDLAALRRGDRRLRWLDLCGNAGLEATPGETDARGRVAPDVCGAPRTRVVNSIGMHLAEVPAGTFLMGAPDDEAGAFPNEKPRHRITLTRPFYLGVYPVTQREYELVTGANLNLSLFAAGFGGGPWHPVENVGRDDALEFCRRLSELPEEKKAGRTYRLPTEAEWEHACRAGTTTPYAFDDISGLANFSAAQTEPVGSYPPNEFGLFDMHGNVWEWVNDFYQADYYAQSPECDPPGPSSGSTHVLRGGGWYIVDRGIRSAERCYTGEAPVQQPGTVGFRVAMDFGK